jgi:hypothetical protein
MGEVWRARDTRLGRDVAVKVLPSELESNADRLKRFEREARAASSLSHPNIVTVYEIARSEGTSFIAMELVDGETLRALIAGSPLSLRRILALAPQIAEGLARAHAAGLVHRDLKPENLMVTQEGLVKILDFGLAKLTRPEEESGGTQPTVSMVTRPGIAMGTVSYMSPEQALGHPLDFRSDQFSLGAILYEMATGKVAFRRDSAPQTLAAIIEDEPEPMSAVAPRTPAPLRWVIARCLSKEARGRYASTEDLARELGDLRDHVTELSTSAGVEIEQSPRPSRWRLAAVLTLAGVALGAMFLLGRRVERAGVEHAGVSEPRFRQLTSRGAGIGSARFAPDGQTVVFSAQTEGRPPELLSMRLDSPEARSLQLPPAQILSISSAGEMAILLAPPYALGPRAGHMAFEQALARDPFLLDGVLAEAPLGGGAPKEILEDVSFADWDPNGTDLAVIHRSGNQNRLEQPIGTTVFESEQNILVDPRVGPREKLAFKDWALTLLKEGSQPVRRLPAHIFAIEHAWFNRTGELWYTVGPGSELAGETDLRAITPGGHDRLVARLPADFLLYDIAADGRVLLGRVVESSEILGTFPDEPRERNLSYFNKSSVDGLTARGDALLFGDFLERGDYSWFRRTDGSPPKRLRGCTDPVALSSDGTFLLCEDGTVPFLETPTRFSIVPIGPGEARRLDASDVFIGIVDATQTRLSPDGRRIFFCGAQKGGHRKIWTQDIGGGKPRPITPDDVRRPVVVGDGSVICALAPDRAWYLYPVEGPGDTKKVVGLMPGEEPIQSTPDGLLYVRGADELRPGDTLMTTRVYRLDPSNGRREVWKEFPPRDSRTGGAIAGIYFSADGKKCVWTHIRYTTELVLAEGLK